MPLEEGIGVENRPATESLCKGFTDRTYIQNKSVSFIHHNNMKERLEEAESLH